MMQSKSRNYATKTFAVAVLLLGMFASGLQASSYRSLVYPAVGRIFNLPQVTQKMVWANGGISLKEVVKLLEILEPEAYEALQSVARQTRSENPDQFLIQTVIHNTVREKLFRLDTPTTSKYFWGEEPDIRALVDEIVFSDRLIKELEWDRGGLSNGTIIQYLQMQHPDVYDLYVQSTDDKDDYWLRDIITGRIHSSKGRKKLGKTFTKRMRDHTGKLIHIYYKGEEPNIFKLMLRVIGTDDLRDLMMLGRLGEPKGATMDQIVEAIRKHQPSFYALYTHAYKGSPILEGKAYSSASSSETPTAVGINYDYLRRREHGLRSMLGRHMSDSKTFIRDENSEGQTTYRTTMAYIGGR